MRQRKVNLQVKTCFISKFQHGKPQIEIVLNYIIKHLIIPGKESRNFKLKSSNFWQQAIKYNWTPNCIQCTNYVQNKVVFR